MTLHVATKTILLLDRNSWPVETIKGRWFKNFIRRLLYVRKIRCVRATAYLFEDAP